MLPSLLPPAPERSSRAVAVLSPHRDDAAFCGGLVMTRFAEQHVPITLFNFFTRSAYAPYAADQSTDGISRVRREEDEALVRQLGPLCRMRDLEMDDAPVRLGLSVAEVFAHPLTPDQMGAEARTLAERMEPMLAGFALVLMPLGLGEHVDHAIVRDAGQLAAGPDRAAFYEDLPYAARLPDTDRLLHIARVLRSGGGDEDPVTLLVSHDDAATRKRQLVALYPSQIDAGVVDEIVRYTEQAGGERLHGTPAMARTARRLLSEQPVSADQTTTEG